jgi:tetratricopeptide (TPR) repeat protein
MSRCGSTFVLSLVLASGVGWAQDRWQSHIRTGEYAFASGDLERAGQEFEKALQAAQTAGGDTRRLESSLDNLGRLAEHRSRFAEARDHYQRLVDVRSARLGADSPELLGPLQALSRGQAHLGEHGAAEASMVRFLAIAEASGRADPDQESEVLERLSRIFVARSETDKALPLQRRLLGLARAHRADDPLYLAACIEGVAQLELMHGSAADAEQLAMEAADLRSAADDSVGAVQGLGLAATTAVAFAEPELGERLAGRALDLAGEAGLSGADSLPAHRALAEAAWLTVRRGSDRLADLLAVGGEAADLALAEERLLELQELEAAHDDPDPAVAAGILGRLARVKAMQGQVSEAVEWLRRALEASAAQGVVDEQGLADLQDLVDLEVAAGQPERAAASNARLIQALQAVNGAEHASLLDPLERQVELLRELGRKREAKDLRRRLKRLQRTLR